MTRGMSRVRRDAAVPVAVRPGGSHATLVRGVIGGVMLAYRHSSGPIRSPLLLIACAILGLLLDVIPAAMPGLAPSARVASGGATPSIPLPDDSEGDETPDDADDLACST